MERLNQFLDNQAGSEFHTVFSFSLRGRASVTLRQAEVLSLVAAGLTDKQIAAKLGITPRAVSKHLERLYKRFKLRNRADAASMWALGRISGRIDRGRTLAESPSKPTIS